ncbi:hypothetical protein ACWGDX_15665, partial [Streptomyces sp. NPDC055025]
MLESFAQVCRLHGSTVLRLGQLFCPRASRRTPGTATGGADEEVGVGRLTRYGGTARGPLGR